MVLVAEPDQIVCIVTVDILQDAGFRTATACSLEEVLSMLGENPEIQVLITGRTVCRYHDGIELAHRVHDLWPNVHVIVTSGAGGDLLQALPTAVGILQKPYSFDTLLRAVEDGFALINRRASSAP